MWMSNFRVFGPLVVMGLVSWAAHSIQLPSENYELAGADQLRAAIGGTCYTTDTEDPLCPNREVHDCGGCVAGFCGDRIGRLDNLLNEISICDSAYSGLDSCAFSTDYCYFDITCEVACINVGGEWLCELKTSTGLDPRNETFASGSFCGIAANEPTRDASYSVVIASVNGVSFNPFE